MAPQNVTPASPPSIPVVKAFVERYYNILHLSPHMVHRFYQDASILGRPDLDGVMSSVTTKQAINEKILSLNYKDYSSEIETVDAQNSCKGGITILVTGSLTGKDNIRQKFTQSFFLAPQDKEDYFVLNDVSRYVGESQSTEDNLLDNATRGCTTSIPITPNTDVASRNVNPASSPSAPVVGQAFVFRYYDILSHSPDMVHRFYKDISILGRPDLDGVMSSVTTMRAIKAEVMSLKFADCMWEIKTTDAQHSYEGGIIVLVTGSLTRKDNIRRMFSQFFFLSPQDGGYFVLNDIFRYVGEEQTKEDSMPDNATNGCATSTRRLPKSRKKKKPLRRGK